MDDVSFAARRTAWHPAGRGPALMIDAEFLCAFCGQANTTTVDPSAGRHQSYVEDCQACCRPNVLNIEVDPDEPDTAFIEATPES